MFQTTLSLLINATYETLYMIVLSGIITLMFGLPIGIILYITRKKNIVAHPTLHHSLAAIINIMRSIPFVILMVAVIPLTRWIVGTSIGTNAAIVPLSLCAIPFFARIVENALVEVNKGLIEAATAMGASTYQIILKVLIPEALPGIIQGITLTMVSLVGYSAMAGAVGGGGLGDLAIRYGYQRFDTVMMFYTIMIMVILVHIIQYLGDRSAKHFLRVR